MIDALRELERKVVAGECKRFDPLFERAFYPTRRDMADTYAADNAHKGDLNAAKALHEAVLPGWRLARMERYSEPSIAGGILYREWEIVLERYPDLKFVRADESCPARAALEGGK